MALQRVLLISFLSPRVVSQGFSETSNTLNIYRITNGVPFCSQRRLRYHYHSYDFTLLSEIAKETVLILLDRLPISLECA